jgi:hypothetical protein
VSVRRLLGVWLMLAVLMTGNGILREAALMPWFGRTAADVLSATLGVAIILAATRPFLRPLAGLSAARPARVALAWVGLTVVFELVVGHWVDGKSWGELLADYAVWRGRLWPIVLGTVALAPFLWLAGGSRPADGRLTKYA